MIIQGTISFKDRLALAQIGVSGERISSIVTDPAQFAHADRILRDDQLLCPGFIDAQINGGFGREFKTDEDALAVVSKQIPEFGVTSILPTVTTKPLDSYPGHLTALLARYAGPGSSARVLGLHLEGPALNPAKRGAHPAELLIDPSAFPIEEILREEVRQVTIAPELPGGWQLAHALIARDVRVGVGHSLADYDDLVEHFDETTMHIVHAFNAMGELGARTPGLVGFALDRVHAHASVIADLIHVHPAALRVLWESRSRGVRPFGISDGSAVLGLPVGTHRVGTRTIERRHDRAVLQGTETLVGSVLTMNIAARNLMSVTGCELWEAVNFASLNAAKYLGRDSELGSIEVGKFADMCVVDREFNVDLTLVGGVVAFDRSARRQAE